MLRIVLTFIFLSCLATASVAEPEVVKVIDIPYVTWIMETPDYWILRHPAPDKVVMTPERIARFNKDLHIKSLVDDLGQMPKLLPGKLVRAEIRDLSVLLKKSGFFDKDGLPVKAAVYTALDSNVALEAVGRRVMLRPAVTTAFTNQRMMPTDALFCRIPGDVHFDRAQNSAIEPGVPVAVLHESADGQWFFLKDGISSGWVKAADVAWVDQAAWQDMLAPKQFAVVVAPVARIFHDENMWEPLASARMGARFTLKRVTSKAVEVLFPVRGEDGWARLASAFLPRVDVNIGYLRYTPRTVIEQAFKLLGTPYGWGDSGGAVDCSRFVNMVFATVGLHLPRNSSEQGRSGLAAADFDPRFGALDKFVAIAGRGLGGVTLLRLPGHIMIYLGEVDKRLYAIHAAWSYREPDETGGVSRVIGRVAVSDLSLGKGMPKGSLLERITTVRFLGDKEKD